MAALVVSLSTNREEFAERCVDAGKIAEGRDVLDAIDNEGRHIKEPRQEGE